MLFARNRQAGDAQATFFRGVFRKPAPSAADFKDVIARLGAHLVNHRGILGRLCRFEAFLARPEQGRGIGHRIVQPEPVEIVAKIIVVRDVLLGLPARIGLQPEAHTFVGSHQADAGKAVIDRVIVFVDEIHEGLQVGRGPRTVKIGFGKPKIAFAKQAREHIGIMHGHRRDGAGLGPFGAEHTPVRQCHVNAPVLDLLHQPEDPAEIPGQVRLPVHGRDYRHASSLAIDAG